MQKVDHPFKVLKKTNSFKLYAQIGIGHKPWKRVQSGKVKIPVKYSGNYFLAFSFSAIA